MKLRLFVALELPAPARAALAAFRAAAADPAVWRPVPDEALHLTLAFLGHRPEADVPAVVDLHGTLEELQAWVTRELAARGLYEPEARPYRPHATVARLRPDARAGRGAVPGPEPLEFHGEALTLFQSRLRRDGARYEPLASLALSH